MGAAWLLLASAARAGLSVGLAAAISRVVGCGGLWSCVADLGAVESRCLRRYPRRTGAGLTARMKQRENLGELSNSLLGNRGHRQPSIAVMPPYWSRFSGFDARTVAIV